MMIMMMMIMVISYSFFCFSSSFWKRTAKCQSQANMIIKINIFTRRLCDQAQKLFAIKKNCQKSSKRTVAAGGGSGFATLAKDDKKGRINEKKRLFRKRFWCKKGCQKGNVGCIFFVWLFGCVWLEWAGSDPIFAYFIRAHLLQNCGDDYDDHEDNLVMIMMIFIAMTVMILVVMTTMTTV